MGDKWTNLKNIVANFKVDITLLADLGFFGGAIEFLVNPAFDLLTGNPIIGAIIGDCQLRDLDNSDKAISGDSYYQIIVVCSNMDITNAIDLSKAKNQRIVLVTSFKIPGLGKTLEDPVAAGNISKALAAELNQTLVNILLSSLQPNTGRALSKLMSGSPKTSASDFAAKVCLTNPNSKIEYLALTHGNYDIRNGKVPCCYVGLGATLSFAFEFADYVMTDIYSLSSLIAPGGNFLVKNLGVICGAADGVTQVRFTQQAWIVVRGQGGEITVPIQKVQNQLSIMEIATDVLTPRVDIAFEGAGVACHTQALNVSVQTPSDILSDFIPDFDDIFSKKLALGGKLEVTFSGWGNAPASQGTVPLIFEASSDDKIEYDQAKMPSQVTVTRSSIDSRPKPGGPKFILPTWAIVLIAVACIAVVAVVGVVIYYAVFRKQEPQTAVQETTPESAQGNAMVVSNNNNNNNNNNMMMMAAAPQPYQQPYPQQPYPQQQYPQQPYPQQYQQP